MLYVKLNIKIKHCKGLIKKYGYYLKYGDRKTGLVFFVIFPIYSPHNNEWLWLMVQNSVFIHVLAS